ncbi:MAG: MFS transporter [Erysipelotrichaceae bacterium]|nr:MFS transporter [Erysipelotrichaceae bacterium]MDY5252900.1 MFS transporter [Erysipelotrichaceae bacterium]
MKKNNIIIFYVLAFLQGMIFYSCVATLYRLDRGINLWQMGVIDSLFALFIILLELPLGMLCERIGYKKTIIIANGFYLVSKIVFYQATSFGGFLLERFFLALAVAGLSGADSSLIFLSIDDQNEAQKVFGKHTMFSNIGMCVWLLWAIPF